MAPRGFWAAWAAFAVSAGVPYGVCMGMVMGAIDMLTGRFTATRLLATTVAMTVGFGALFGLAMAALFRGVVHDHEIRDAEAFDPTLHAELERLGYRHRATSGDLSRFDPGLRAGVLAGSIYVRRRAREARIVGPRIHVRKLGRALARLTS